MEKLTYEYKGTTRFNDLMLFGMTAAEFPNVLNPDTPPAELNMKPKYKLSVAFNPANDDTKVAVKKDYMKDKSASIGTASDLASELKELAESLLSDYIKERETELKGSKLAKFKKTNWEFTGIVPEEDKDGDETGYELFRTKKNPKKGKPGLYGIRLEPLDEEVKWRSTVNVDITPSFYAMPSTGKYGFTFYLNHVQVTAAPQGSGASACAFGGVAEEENPFGTPEELPEGTEEVDFDDI